jgi:hypothetical protein
MLSLLTAPAFAGNDTYSCDAYAEYYADARGTISVVRRQWSSITYQIAVVHKDEKKEVSTIVFFSGDSLVDARYRNTAPAYTGKMSPASILTWMSKAPLNQVIEESRVKHVTRPVNEHIRTLQSGSVCWKNGDPPPDRSTWPGQAITSNNFCRQWDRVLQSFGSIQMSPNDTGVTRFDCRMSLQYRRWIETSETKELGPQQTATRNESNVCGPKTNAQSSVEAALRHDAGPNAMHGDVTGECVAQPR